MWKNVLYLGTGDENGNLRAQGVALGAFRALREIFTEQEIYVFSSLKREKTLPNWKDFRWWNLGIS